MRALHRCHVTCQLATTSRELAEHTISAPGIVWLSADTTAWGHHHHDHHTARYALEHADILHRKVALYHLALSSMETSPLPQKTSDLSIPAYDKT